MSTALLSTFSNASVKLVKKGISKIILFEISSLLKGLISTKAVINANVLLSLKDYCAVIDIQLCYCYACSNCGLCKYNTLLYAAVPVILCSANVCPYETQVKLHIPLSHLPLVSCLPSYNL